MRIVIVMPTYNESENIPEMIETLSEEFIKISNHEMLLLVVDDTSPDGTYKIVQEKQEKYSWLNLLLRSEKNGLGAAYVAGFKYAMEKLSADVVVEMDADFQHDPKDISRLIEKIDEGYDYVLGSRYTKGGGVDKNWGLKRKFMSLGGMWFSKIVLGIYSINDFTGGFKASRVKGFVNQMDLNTIISKGFAYKLELLYRMHKLGAKITEIPIMFGARYKGESKMEKNNVTDSMKVVLTLRLRDSKSLIRFLVVGTIGFITDMTLSNIFARSFENKAVATSSAALIAMLVTFILNNLWSFSDRKITKIIDKIVSISMYIVFSAVPILFRFYFVGLIMNLAGYSFLSYNLSILFCIFLGLIWNYTVYSKIIWKKKK